MSRNFWKSVAARDDNGVREALGAARALAEEGMVSRDASFFQRILGVIDVAMLPRGDVQVEAPVSMGYGRCEGQGCPSHSAGVQRKLYAVGGFKICLGCRKRLAQQTL